MCSRFWFIVSFIPNQPGRLMIAQQDSWPWSPPSTPTRSGRWCACHRGSWSKSRRSDHLCQTSPGTLPWWVMLAEGLVAWLCSWAYTWDETLLNNVRRLVLGHTHILSNQLLPSGKRTWKQKITTFEGKSRFKWLIFHLQVCLLECKWGCTSRYDPVESWLVVGWSMAIGCERMNHDSWSLVLGDTPMIWCCK